MKYIRAFLGALWVAIGVSLYGWMAYRLMSSDGTSRESQITPFLLVFPGLMIGFGVKWIRSWRTAAPNSQPDQAVIVRFNYGQTDLSPLRALESRLEKLVEDQQLGEYDGDEIAVSLADGSLYFYGPDADRLWGAIKGPIGNVQWMHGARVTLRYGSKRGSAEREVVVGANA